MAADAIREKIAQTPFIDTHEHLLEERTRLHPSGPGASHVPCLDAALLLYHYGKDDLRSAGMPTGDWERFYAPDEAADVKWNLLAPYWARCRATGYMQAVTRTIHELFGEDDLDAAAFARIGERMRAHARPGFYRAVLQRAGVESCQVNSFEATFCDSEHPDLLMQDLSIMPCTTALDLGRLREETGISPATLEDMEGVQDWYFQRHGARAVAVKSSAAYARRLDYAETPRERAAPIFARYARGGQLAPEERKALEDYLMRRCLRLAGEHRLPVKLHCGYYAGNDRMPLDRVGHNASDLCPLLAAFPDTTFVLMHIGYPFQDQYIALAKQYTNAHVDLCWAWIINPLATVRFVREFLVAAPASKLFAFGGDYANVELIVGHAHLARQGLTHAFTELVQGGWMRHEVALDVVDLVMHGNARRVFKLAAGRTARTPEPRA